MFAQVREPVNAYTHLGGALLATVGLLWMLNITYPDPPRMVVSMIYGISLIFCLLSSGVMHSYPGKDERFRFLVRVDHAAIYVLIAGSYTPFSYVYFEGALLALVLTVVWALALCGVYWKLVHWRNDSLLSVGLYVVLGWGALLLLPYVLPFVTWSVGLLILAGGLVFSVGAIVFHLQRPNLNEWFGFHELWHLFVLGGCALHFAAVFLVLL